MTVLAGMLDMSIKPISIEFVGCIALCKMIVNTGSFCCQGIQGTPVFNLSVVASFTRDEDN